jgi:hypothetical protein
VATDTCGPTIISRHLPVPDNYSILQSPLSPSLKGISAATIKTQEYVVIPLYFHDLSTMNGNCSLGRIVKITVEFQVVEQCDAGFLLGIDTMCKYKMVVNAVHNYIHIESF